jgi:uncharacterized protein
MRLLPCLSRLTLIGLLALCLSPTWAWADLSVDQASMLQGAAANGDEHALQQLEQAALDGDQVAEYALGTLYDDGRGVPHDPVRAESWIRKAAVRGYPLAEYRLAMLYDGKHGGLGDEVQAAFWYRKAADQGMPQAQYELGEMYLSGLGVPQDTLQAIKWLSLAKQSGYAQADVDLQQSLDQVPSKDLARVQKQIDTWWAEHHRSP